MRLDWKKCLWLMALLGGCRTSQPELKPPPSPEVLNAPPSEQRFNTAIMPKEAFEKDSPLKRREFDSTSIIPTRGSSMAGMGPGGPSMGGPPR